MISSSAIPENIRRRMPREIRHELNVPTQPEADAKFLLRGEKKLQENIAALLRQRDIMFFRQSMGRRTTGTVGWPDFTFAIRGQACAVECKVPGGVVTQEQKSVLDGLYQNGWRVRICRSEDALLRFIREVEQSQPNADEPTGAASAPAAPGSKRKAGDFANYVYNGQWTCKNCGGAIMAVVWACSSGRVESSKVPYCPNCDEKPSSRGSPIQ